MALVGIWGHSCVGKTTWLKGLMEQLADMCPGLSIIIADNEQEYHHDPVQDAWVYKVNRERWKGSKAQKAMWPIQNIVLDQRLWIIESMRYFNGMQAFMIEGYRARGCTGLSMILPYAESIELYREMQRQRCTILNKPMSPWWELDEHLEKEIKYRAGSGKKWWEPNGVPHKLVAIDPQRKNWVQATEFLLEQVRSYAESV